MNKKLYFFLFSFIWIIFSSCSNGSDNLNANSSDNNSTEDIEEELDFPQAYNETFIPGNTSIEMARAMKTGWNLGNTLDAMGTDDWSYSLGLDTEEYWGNTKATKNLIKAVKAKGFVTLRIPVSWHNHISRTDTTNYKIDDEWMQRVKQVVDWGLEEGMCVVLNIHHDNFSEITYYEDNGQSKKNSIYENAGYCISGNTNVRQKSKRFINRVWTQIAETFKDYDNKLVFEILNEPGFKQQEADNWNWSNSQYYQMNQILNDYQEEGIRAIRAVGGANTNRYIMVTRLLVSCSMDGWELPDDTVSDRLIFTAHFYSTYSSEYSFYSVLNMVFPEFNAFLLKGIGVVIGESGMSTDYSSPDIRITDYQERYSKFYEYGIPCFLWDNGKFLNDYPGDMDCYGYINRKNYSWTYEAPVTILVRMAHENNPIESNSIIAGELTRMEDSNTVENWRKPDPIIPAIYFTLNNTVAGDKLCFEVDYTVNNSVSYQGFYIHLSDNDKITGTIENATLPFQDSNDIVLNHTDEYEHDGEHLTDKVIWNLSDIDIINLCKHNYINISEDVVIKKIYLEKQ